MPAQETTQPDFPQVSLQFGEACHENVILSPGTRTELRKTNSATTADRTAEQIDAHLHTLSLCNTVIHCNIHTYIYIFFFNSSIKPFQTFHVCMNLGKINNGFQSKKNLVISGLGLCILVSSGIPGSPSPESPHFSHLQVTKGRKWQG